MSRQEIADLITRLGDITTTLRRADPDDKAEVYRHLGLHLSYDPNRQIVRAEARGKTVRVEGRTQTGSSPRTWEPSRHAIEGDG